MSKESTPSRVAIITGASSGIGEATAIKLAEAGISVVLATRRRELLEALHAKITDAGGSALMVETDVTSRAQVEAMV